MGAIYIIEFNVKDIDLKIAKSLSKETCELYNLIPVKEDELNVICLTCEDISLPEYIKFLYSKEVILYKVSKSNFQYIKTIVFGEEKRNLDDSIIYKAIDMSATDIHFEPAQNYVNVRYRINGVLLLITKIDVEEYLKVCSKIKIHADMDITEKRRPQDGKILLKHNKLKYDLRVSTIPVVFGEKIVIRILYCDNFNYKLEDLGFEDDKIRQIRRISSLNNGLIIINGPTGSGKSTTMYTLLKELDSSRLNITTLEDPVEVYLPNINQVNLNKKIGLDFSSGLRSLLRQDPDIIMVGEIRDEETAKMAVRASITGHKVYSTIHAKSPREVYLRLENMGVKSYLLRESLIGIISQRLVKILCSNCKLVDSKNKYKNKVIYKRCGCNKCNYSGYEGRKIISTVYFLDKDKKKSFGEIYKDSDFLDNYNMKKDLEKLLLDGKISFDDYYSFIESEMIDLEKKN